MLSLQLFQPFHHRRFLRYPDPGRQRIDEYPHHRLHTFQINRSARHDGTEYYVVLSAVSAQQQGPSPLQQRVQCHLMPARPALQLLRFFSRQLQHPLPILALLRLALSAASCPRQRYRSRESVQLLSPIRFRFLHLLFAQPFNIFHIRNRWLPFPAFSLSQRFILREYITPHQRPTPPVNQRVMNAPHETVHLILHSDQLAAHRRPFQCKPPAAVRLQKPLLLCLLPCSVHMPPVLQGKVQFRFLPYHLVDSFYPFPHEARPENAVPLHGLPPGAAPVLRLELPFQRQHKLHYVVPTRSV
ncbi:hypothetical protein D3C75_683870 [compost metagenome]